MKICRKTRIAMILAVLLTAVVLTAAAVSGSALKSVYDAGKQLLFDTTNVTLNGTAEFSLDGERFKTVEAKYVQDGVNSVWDYKLYSPRPDGTGDRESGYTVYANGESIYTADRRYPGSYRNGFDEEHNTLVQRSALMDQAVQLAGTAVACMEPLLPEGAVQVLVENHTGKTVHVVLGKDNVDELTNTAFNLCAQMVIRRAIEPVDFDRLPSPYVPFDDFLTPAKAIINCTERYDLDSLDVTATLDGNGDLRSLTGSVKVMLGIVGDSQRTLDCTFDVKASGYGTSRLKIFDPEAEGLIPQWKYGYEEEFEYGEGFEYGEEF